MALKRIVEALEDVEESYRDLYSEVDGKYTIAEIDGFIPAEKHREFVNNNKSLFVENETLKTQAAELESQNKSLQSTASNRDEEEKKRMSGAKDEFENRLKALEEANAEKDRALSAERLENRQTRIRDEIKKVAVPAGGKPKALDDIAAALLPEFDYNDEGALVRKVNGQVVLSEDNPGQAQTLQERMVGFALEKDYFFGASAGDQARGSVELDGEVIGADPASMANAALKFAEAFEKDKA